ncbi:CpaF family protein [Acidipropionibacterium acidipropionici]|uniref:Type II/IV secretion system protein n=1 Tax=Acidipropionibacterium acidipropionici TaxID=1748 RepID=A0AAC8YCS0_9ACTN|nr:CpaF/VirB11 family protein [Acidipropionibacterium acidipropionici]AMS04113.1 type II/IV secretion system protein [Acidipropionibacterium acidipropionici]
MPGESPFAALSWTPVQDQDEQAGPDQTSPAADLTSAPLFSQPAAWQAETPEAVHDSSPATDIDWTVVADLVSTVSETVTEQEQRYAGEHQGAQPDPQTRRVMTDPVIGQVVGDYARRRELDGELWDQADENRYRKAATDQMFGMGRLQPLFEIPDAENIIINGTRPVIVDYNDGHRDTLPPVADSDEELVTQLQRMALNATPPRAFDADHTDVTITHGQRFRIHAVSGEVALHPSVVIRQHLLTRISLGDMTRRNMIPVDVARFLDAAVQDGATIVVAGDQGAGKTTFLRALIHAIPHRERFATLETDEELFAHLDPGRDDVLTMFARDGMGDLDPETGRQIGAIEIGQLIPPALRQSLNRIVVGEVRGSEASAMFQAMQSGAGTMSSIHAREPEEVASRLAMMIAQGRVYNLEEAMRQIGQSVDYIVFVRRRDLPDGSRIRFVERIEQVSIGDDYRPALGQVYSADTLTGQMEEFRPGPAADRYGRLYRDLDYLEEGGR